MDGVCHRLTCMKLFRIPKNAAYNLRYVYLITRRYSLLKVEPPFMLLNGIVLLGMQHESNVFQFKKNLFFSFHLYLVLILFIFVSLLPSQSR